MVLITGKKVFGLPGHFVFPGPHNTVSESTTQGSKMMSLLEGYLISEKHPIPFESLFFSI